MNNTNFTQVQDFHNLVMNPDETPATFKVEQKIYGRRYTKIDAKGNELSTSFKLSKLTKDIFHVIETEPRTGFVNKEAMVILDTIDLIERLETQEDSKSNAVLHAIAKGGSLVLGFPKRRKKIITRINRDTLGDQRKEYLNIDVPTKANTLVNKSVYGNRHKPGHLKKMTDVFNVYYGNIDGNYDKEPERGPNHIRFNPVLDYR